MSDSETSDVPGEPEVTKEAENRPSDSEEPTEESPEFFYRVEVLTDRPNSTSAAIQEFETVTGTEIQENRDDDRSRVIFYQVGESPEARSTVQMQAEMYFAALPDLNAEVDSCELFTDESWKTRWKDFFEPTLVSPRAMVGPPWESFGGPKGGTRLVINPAMAFGVGTHETTQLSATLLDWTLKAWPAEADPPSVLDVGCGSAILGMIAAELGAGPVVGIDIDEEALESARENLETNHLQDEVELSSTPLEDIEATFDIVVANIIAATLLELRDGLIERVGEDGKLILSGIPSDYLERFLGDFVPAGWTIDERINHGAWAALVLSRTSDH